MMRPRRFLTQIRRHMRREKRLSVGSFLVLVIALVLIDLFWIAYININYQYDQVLKTVRMEVFLNDIVPDSAIPAIETALQTFDGVASLKFVSKEEALLILESDLGPGVLDQLGDNPLPRSFVLRFGRTLNLDELDALSSQIKRLSGVDAVEYGRPWIEKVERFGNTLRSIGLLVGGLIALVVILTMANTNRLTARTKSRDFQQLKLLGAGPSYLLYPFLSEGFLSAFIAAFIGWIGIFYLIDWFNIVSFVILLPPFSHIILYALGMGLTGMFGAYLGIRRFLLAS